MFTFRKKENWSREYKWSHDKTYFFVTIVHLKLAKWFDSQLILSNRRLHFLVYKQIENETEYNAGVEI